MAKQKSESSRRNRTRLFIQDGQVFGLNAADILAIKAGMKPQPRRVGYGPVFKNEDEAVQDFLRELEGGK